MNPIPVSFGLKIKAWWSAGWTVSTLICVPGLLAITAYWTLGGGAKATFVSSQTHHVTQSQNTIDLVAVEIPGQVLYQMRLVDKKGVTVYSYPREFASGEELGNLVIKIPSSVKNGEYDLYSEMTYAKNPIRTETVEIKLAHVNVGD